MLVSEITNEFLDFKPTLQGEKRLQLKPFS